MTPRGSDVAAASTALAAERARDLAAQLVEALRAARLEIQEAGAGYSAHLQLLTQLGHQVAAERMALVVAADHAEVAADSGMASTSAWVARLTAEDPAKAAREVTVAGRLTTSCPDAADALSAGQMSPDHAAVITEAVARLPHRLSSEEKSTVERALIAQAHTLGPKELRRAARRALAAVEPDPQVVDAHEDQLLHDREVAARAKTRLTLHDNDDGTVSGHFTVPTFAGHVLRKVIHEITSPRRARLGATQAQAGDLDLQRDPAHTAGRAFAEILEHLPTDRLAAKSAATVVVTIDEAKLHAVVGAAGLDTGEVISAGEARRIACGAGLLPAVLNGESLPLDLGRTKRLFTEKHQLGVSARFDRCAADGCDRPMAWCELHHRQPWSRGGATDVDNLVPLCGFHHDRVHDRDYDHEIRPDGAWIFHRKGRSRGSVRLRA